MTPLAVFLFSLLILNTGVTSGPDGSQDSLDKEKTALLTFISKVRHDPRKVSWKESEPVCSWKGVSCDPDNTTVLYLRLPAKSLVGEIPPDTIGSLTNLRVLSLRINNFSGSIPADFSNLTSLTILSLTNNSFTGQLPSMLNFKDNLIKFNVSLNKLNSSVPSSLSKFPKSSFDINVFFCGKPFNITCNSSYPSPDIKPIEEKKNPKKKGVIIIGISVGSAALLLIFLCKKIYQKRKQPRKQPSTSASAYRAGTSKEEGNKLVFVDEWVYSFGLEDLLYASADVLGEGSVGISYKQVVRDEKTVVVKRLKDVVVTEEEFRRKMEVLGKMKNKNVVPMIAYYNSKDEKWLVYDHMPAGSLFAQLHGSTGSGRTQLDWDNRMRIALSAAKGLKYLHEAEKVVHGNIKSSNILLQQEKYNEASLSDYGLNTLFNHQVAGYWAPEVPEAQKITSESDVYSFGVLLLELLTGQTPKQQASLDNKEVFNFSKWVETIVGKEPKDEIFDLELRRGHNIEEMVQLLRIAKSCVSRVPDQRPKMHDVVSEMEDMWLRPSSDDRSKGYDYTPSTTETRDTPSTITP